VHVNEGEEKARPVSVEVTDKSSSFYVSYDVFY